MKGKVGYDAKSKRYYVGIYRQRGNMRRWKCQDEGRYWKGE